MADGCAVKHKIERIGNSDGTSHVEAAAPVRQVADHTIDRRGMTFEDNVGSLESAVALYVSALLRRLFHGLIFWRWHCDFFPSIRDTMPEDRFVLVFLDARF
jgi:hypothetical protein